MENKFCVICKKEITYGIKYCIDCGNTVRKNRIKEYHKSDKYKEYLTINKEKNREYSKKYQKANRKTDISKQKNKEWRETSIVHKKYLEELYKTDEYKKLIKNKIIKEKEERLILSDNYIINVIWHTYKIPFKTIKKHPELIESYRGQIENKRLIKLKKSCQKQKKTKNKKAEFYDL